MFSGFLKTSLLAIPTYASQSISCFCQLQFIKQKSKIYYTYDIHLTPFLITWNNMQTVIAASCDKKKAKNI